MPSPTARTTAPARATVSASASAIALAACTFSVPAADASGLTLIQFTPAGEFQPGDGRKLDVPAWRIDAASADAVIARHAALTQPVVIDYEHQTLNKEKNGQPAPAAAWVRELRWVEDEGLFGVVELTAKARASIDAKEYLYFSPVFEYDKRNGTVLAIHMGALTNTPGIHGMQPLSLLAAATAAFLPATSAHTPQEHSVNPLLKALLTVLGLPETTDENGAIAALTALGPIKPLQERAVAACTALNLPADATAQAVTAACTSLRTANPAEPDPAKFVPVGVVDEMRTQLAALTAQGLDRQIDDLVKPALADGRLYPAQEDWARKLGKTNVAALTSYLQTAQPIAALTSTQTGGLPPSGLAKGDAKLSPDEMAVCTAMGMSAEQYKSGASSAA